MDNEVIRTRKEGRNGWVTLNRPDAMNTFTAPFAAGLDEALKKMEDDPEVLVVIIEAAGRNFCTGISLDQFTPRTSGNSGRSCTRSTRSITRSHA